MNLPYVSTRGNAPELDFRDTALAGLATDGGLYVPKSWPVFPGSTTGEIKDCSYQNVAFDVLKPFIGSIVPDSAIRDIIQKAYARFDEAAITPLRQLNDYVWLLELFQGPTLAFKDLALQLLGGFFEYFLAASSDRMTVIGATSGDTGSAAIAALAGRKNIDVFILYPQKGPSDIQRKQMTCVQNDNVHALAIEGSFDDCQAIVKALFNDPILRAKHKFGAVNSINWLRILGQMVYYFKAASAFAPRPVSFVVPTGNFGNVFSAYSAFQSGLPISKLAVANNRNDILTRFFSSGRMKAEPVSSTLSPSMDIQVSSNFERLLFELCQRDSSKVRHYMQDMQQKGDFSVAPLELAKARQLFTAAHVSDMETLATIKDIYSESGIILDPHTAVGVAASRKLVRELPGPVIALGCAHPAKFPETIKRAIGIEPALPEKLHDLLRQTERITSLPPSIAAIEKFITERTVS